MATPHVRQEPPSGGFEVIVAVIGGLIVAVATVAFAGAWLAATVSGGWVSGGIGDWLAVTGRLASAPGDPTEAWAEHAGGLPGPALYWGCTLVVAVAVSVVVTAVVWVWRRWSSPSRSRFGVPTDARVARPRDARPLTVPGSVPPTGRLLLGRLAPRGPMLATEDRERHPAKGRRATMRQGDRGSVALIGPTRSGKTVLASAGIIGWDGPVVALSVKRDLYDTTAAARARRGELAVFDPGGVTGLPTARWTPLRDVTTTSGAARAGRALAQAIPRNGVTGGDFWASHGETLTSAYMSLAGLSQLVAANEGGRREPLTIGRLATWAYMHIGITDPTANELVRLGLADTQPLEVRLLAKDAMTKLMAFEGEDPRIRASIYATARLAFEAWTEPAVAHSASLDPRDFYWADEIRPHQPRYVDLDWLMDGEPGRSNTLYLTAPSTEFARLAPVLGGLLGDLREQIHAWDIAGRRLAKPLLIVIDEAGQLELQWLPEEVSTIAGLGGMFLTGWQSKSQITHRYGTLADAVLGGHRSKVIFSGTDDPSTLDYVSRVAGTEHVAQRGWSADTGGGRKTVSEHVQREDLLPAHVIRQMRRQEAVLIHGTLPPIHLRLVRWWEDHDLKALVPTGPDRKPLAPPEAGTCPVWPHQGTSPEPVLDPTVVAESVANLPKPRGQRDDRPLTSGAHGRPARPADRGQGQLDLAHTLDEPSDRNRVAGVCETCGKRLPVGAGTTVSFGGRTVIRCHPACP
ncbi:MAG: type IV secretory system conjugative DNA transfer family protein [Mycolicibacterium neoaurum]|nr:type IV secretory system conjugative DNA transfer family protein [Mycolicibacterium neoaurum]